MTDRTSDERQAVNQMADRGRVTWHSSGEDEGPDVGISLGLGGSRMLWAGEITDRRHGTGGPAVAALGDSGGWWLMMYPDGEVIARFVDAEMAGVFFDLLRENLK